MQKEIKASSKTKVSNKSKAIHDGRNLEPIKNQVVKDQGKQ